MQCPKCQLRFLARREVRWHLRLDHRRTTGLGLPDRLHGPTHRRGPLTIRGEGRTLAQSQDL